MLLLKVSHVLIKNAPAQILGARVDICAPAAYLCALFALAGYAAGSAPMRGGLSNIAGARTLKVCLCTDLRILTY